MQRMKTIRLLALLIAGLMAGRIIVFAQTSDTAQKQPKFRFDVSGGFYHQMSGGEKPQVILPDYLKKRRPQEPHLTNIWDLHDGELPDSPLGHGASYFTFHTWTDITPSLQLYGSFTADHRGFSFAPYNTLAIAFLARYHAAYNNAIPLFKGADSLKLYGRIGTHENYRNNEGLTLYNMDVQGLEGGLQWRKLAVSAQRIADLQFGIGLNIDGVIDYKLGFKDLTLNRKWEAEVGIGRQKYESRPDADGVKYFTAAVFSKNIRWYVETGYRNSGLNVDAALNVAFLAGMRGKISRKKTTLSYSAEYRYYGGGFNHSLRKETNTHYRDTAKGPGLNYIGNNVYPLSFLNRPFSQWAVFTEYDKQWVGGFTINAQLKQVLFKNFYLLAEIDYNLIRTQAEAPFAYPFYKIGAMVEAAKGTCLVVSITNKTMNLDKHYTTYYLIDKPLLQFELRRDISL